MSARPMHSLLHMGNRMSIQTIACDQVEEIGDLAQRFEMLSSELSFVATAFPSFQRQIIQYLDENPLSFQREGFHDGEMMLLWLQKRKRLTDEQRDFIAHEQARIAVETLARTKRLECTAFQERYNQIEESLREYAAQKPVQILLNPIRIWTKFHSRALLEDGMEPPANILFFAGDSTVCTACLDLEGQVLVNELADFQPCTLQQWQSSTAFGDGSRLENFIIHFARIGLVAFV
jgi:hypothetical protein